MGCGPSRMQMQMVSRKKHPREKNLVVEVRDRHDRPKKEPRPKPEETPLVPGPLDDLLNALLDKQQNQQDRNNPEKKDGSGPTRENSANNQRTPGCNEPLQRPRRNFHFEAPDDWSGHAYLRSDNVHRSHGRRILQDSPGTRDVPHQLVHHVHHVHHDDDWAWLQGGPVHRPIFARRPEEMGHVYGRPDSFDRPRPFAAIPYPHPRHRDTNNAINVYGPLYAKDLVWNRDREHVHRMPIGHQLFY